MASTGALPGSRSQGGIARARLVADVQAHGAVPAGRRDQILGPDWRTSKDQVVTATGDGSGLHILAAKEDTGYTWHTATTLSEPGLDASDWIGNTCTTPDGRYEAAVYAPSRWANEADTLERGAFAAVVDLASGKVTKLGFTASLAYFDPGCGNGDEAVFTGYSSAGTTRLVTVDAATGKTEATVTLPAEVTSAVPAPGGTLAAQGERVINVHPDGHISTVATTPGGTPLRINPTADGAVFLATTQDARREQVEYAQGGRTTVLAQGLNGQFGLSAGHDGRVFVTGSPHLAAHIDGVAASSAPAGAALSALGDLAVTATAAQPLMDADPVRKGQRHPDPAAEAASLPPGAVLPVAVQATAMHSGTGLEFYADPTPTRAAATGTSARSAPSPSVKHAVTRTVGLTAPNAVQQASDVTASGDATDTVDEDHYCAVPRNDPSVMVYQPTPNQVEWAVDRAVMGELTSSHISRPANWNDSGLPAWSPQGMFPLPALSTGGHIPPQVLLGVLSQESNLWQASSHAEPGEFANPLIGNYYGANVYPGTTGYNAHGIWTVDWDKADCGYGIGQVTDGMRLPAHPKPGESELPADQQKAVAVDYATNIAYAARLLATKWNELHTSGQSITINNDDPSKIENWFAAVWDYNEGLNPPGSGANWGLGWLNNPANPIYPADRGPFLDQNISCDLGTAQAPATGWTMCSQSGAINVADGYSAKDAAQPQHWPYEEKVMGWAAESIDTGRSYDNTDHKQQPGDPGFSTMGFSPAWWTTDADRIAVKPPLAAFCNASNACDVSNPPQCEVQHLGASCDPPHWFHQSNVTWKADCASSCGNEHFTFVNSYPTELANAQPVTPVCGSPGGTVVGSVHSTLAEPACPGGETWSDGGSFHFTFPAVELPGDNPSAQYQAKEDLEQDSSGFGGHYWFAHTRDPGAAWDADQMNLTGEWDPTLSTHLYQVQAYMPYLGSMTQNAEYHVYDGSGNEYTRTVNQSSTMNGWTTIGYFQLGPGAKVTLSNTTHDGDTGNHTIAFDAMRFEPIAGTWQHHTFDAASIFSQNQDLHSNPPPGTVSPMSGNQAMLDWAKAIIQGGTTATAFDGHTTWKGLDNYPACTSGQFSATCVPSDVLASAQQWTADMNSSSGHYLTIPQWLGFSNPTPPSTIDPNHSFIDDTQFKIKTHIDAQWASGPDGKVIPGSEQVTYSPRTGDTELSPVVEAFVKATAKDYGSLGVTVPDLSFSLADANVYGNTETIPNPFDTGTVVAQAYADKEDPAKIDSSGSCVQAKIISGGAIAYRSLDPAVGGRMSAWVDKLASLAAAGKVPADVSNAAGEFYNLFFRPIGLDGVKPEGSLFNMAAPIWQNISMDFCSDGTIKQTQNAQDLDDNPKNGLVYQSYMPDLYLYYDGHQVGEDGKPTTGPVQHGDFASFSNMPTGLDKTGWGPCYTGSTGNTGNPWSIPAAPSQATFTDPATQGAVYCDATQPVIPPLGG